MQITKTLFTRVVSEEIVHILNFDINTIKFEYKGNISIIYELYEMIPKIKQYILDTYNIQLRSYISRKGKGICKLVPTYACDKIYYKSVFDTEPLAVLRAAEWCINNEKQIELLGD